MGRSKLKQEILEQLLKITPLGIKSIREKIARLVTDTGLTHNAAAHLIATQYNKSLMRHLEVEDKTSWQWYVSSVSLTTTVVKPTRRVRSANEKNQKKNLINYESSNPSHSYFVDQHIRELTDAYYAKCYTAVFILFRKIVENLIIDILKTKFPSRIDLVFSPSQRRYHDFSVVLQNLLNEKDAFSHDGKKAIGALYGLVEPFRKEANDKTHSWFYIVKSPSEVDKDRELEPIMQLLIFLEKEVGIRPK